MAWFINKHKHKNLSWSLTYIPEYELLCNPLRTVHNKYSLFLSKHTNRENHTGWGGTGYFWVCPRRCVVWVYLSLWTWCEYAATVLTFALSILGNSILFLIGWPFFMITCLESRWWNFIHYFFKSLIQASITCRWRILFTHC